MCVKRGSFLISLSWEYFSQEFQAQIGYLAGGSWHTVAQHKFQGSEMSLPLRLEDWPPLQAFHYLQKQIAVK